MSATALRRPGGEARLVEAIEATAEDGVRLALRRFPAVGKRRGVLLATHAMWANGGYFDRPRGAGFASHLARLGFEVWVLDFRGHGRSQAPASGWTFDDYVRLDLPASWKRWIIATREMRRSGRRRDLRREGVNHAEAPSPCRQHLRVGAPHDAQPRRAERAR